ncbi:MAG: tetratricopeptide repeat protein [Alphaproteobacteria bacterium]
MQKITLRSTILLIAFISLSLFNIVLASDNVKIEVNSENKYLRVIFHNIQNFKFDSILNNNIITLKFDKALSANLDNLISDSNQKITKALYSIDNKAINLTLNSSNYQIRKFISDSFIGIDIIPIEVNDQSQLPEAQTASPKEELINENKNTIQENSVIKPEAPNAESLTPAPNNIQIQQDIALQVKAISDSTTNIRKIYFPWKKPVASSVFYRSGYLWIIFDSKSKFDFQNLFSVFPEFKNIEQIENDKYSVLRINSPILQNFIAYKEYNNWIIELTPNITPPNHVITEYDTPYSKGLFFPAENIYSSPLNIIDPAIGDQLSIVLLYDSSRGVDKMRHFINFKILPSFQGFVVNIFSKDVKINIIVPGIEIIVPNKDIGSVGILNGKITNNYSLLPFDKWQNINDFSLQKLLLEKDIVNAYPQEKNKARLELAKFYLGNSLANECLGVFKIIKSADSEYAKENEALFLKGVCEVLSNRNIEAKKTFNMLNIDSISEYDKAEINFWKEANNVILKTENANMKYLAYKERFLKTYPSKIRQNFAFLDLENSLNNDLNYSGDLMKELSKEDFTLNNANLYKYYQGVFLEKKGQSDAALKIWQALTEEVDDRRTRALASFAIVNNLYSNGKILANEAIDKLNKIIYIWRGDELELSILKFLGDLYYENKNYIETLRTWKKIANNFSENADSLFITVRMGQLFSDIFSENGLIKDMSDFQAVSLFYEFRELTPIGKLGDSIIQNLAYKLVKLDLLDKAEDLLEHQINYRLEGEDRLKAASNLAFIYLLNKKPVKTIELLTSTDNNVIDEERKKVRNLFRAKAFIDLEKYPEAISYLLNDESEEAKNLLTQLYFKTKEWDKAIDILEPMTVSKEYSSSPIEKKDEDNILKLALSYYMTNNIDSALELYRNVRDKINNNELKSTLEFISTTPSKIDVKNLEESLEIKSMENFLNTYKKNLANK